MMKNPSTPAKENRSSSSSASQSTAVPSFQSPRFLESLSWLRQMNNNNDFDTIMTKKKSDVMKLRKENERLSNECCFVNDSITTNNKATTTFHRLRDISNDRDYFDVVDMKKTKTEMLLLRAQLLDIDAREKQTSSSHSTIITDEEIALKELKLERERRIKSTEKLKGQLFNLQKTHEETLKECRELREEFEQMKDKKDNILRSSEEKLTECALQINELQDERTIEQENHKRQIESAVLIAETRANEAEIKAKDLEYQIKNLKSEHEEEMSVSNDKIAELENALESFNAEQREKEIVFENVTEKYTIALKKTQDMEVDIENLVNELKEKENELESCKVEMLKTIDVFKNNELLLNKRRENEEEEKKMISKTTQTDDVNNNIIDKHDKDEREKMMLIETIESKMNAEFDVQKHEMMTKIASLEQSVNTLEKSLRMKQEESETNEIELKETRKALLNLKEEQDILKKNAEKNLRELSDTFKTSEEDKSKTIERLTEEIDALKTTLRETERDLDDANEKFAQTPPRIKFNINEGDYIGKELENQKVNELSTRCEHLRTRLAETEKKLEETEHVRFSEREAAAAQVRLLVQRTSELLSGKINSTLVNIGHGVDDENETNVIEYVAGTLDSWFGLNNNDTLKEEEEDVCVIPDLE